MDETVKLVNPEYRRRDALIRQRLATLSRKTRAYGELILEAAIDEPAVARYTEKKSALRKEIEVLTKVFPGTHLRLVYSLVSNQIPAGQEF